MKFFIVTDADKFLFDCTEAEYDNFMDASPGDSEYCRFDDFLILRKNIRYIASVDALKKMDKDLEAFHRSCSEECKKEEANKAVKEAEKLKDLNPDVDLFFNMLDRRVKSRIIFDFIKSKAYSDN